MSFRRLKLPRELADFVSGLPPVIKKKVRAGLEAILTNPQEGKPLREELAGLWTLRVGRFRIVYRIQDSLLEIVAVGPRESVYQEAALRLSRMKKIPISPL